MVATILVRRICCEYSQGLKAAVRRCRRYVDERRSTCSGTTRLELHHRHPFAMGGDHSLANVRSMCRSHNRFLAECDYGRRAVGRHRGGAFRHPRGSRRRRAQVKPRPHAVSRTGAARVASETFGGVEEAERARAVLRRRLVVDEVRAHDPLHVAAVRPESVTEAVVNGDVVEAEIGGSVGGHPEAQGQQQGIAVRTVIDKDDRRQREEHPKVLVGFEPAHPRPVGGTRAGTTRARASGACGRGRRCPR